MSKMYEYKIKRLVKVIDGDTIDVEIDLGFDVSTTQRLRLAGIDTPESRTVDPREKTAGLFVKEWLTKTLSEGSFIVKTTKLDNSEKYGRMLGTLYKGTEKESINEKMIRLGYAWAYDGGTKEKDLTKLKI